jgi:hypothetical protein
LSKKVSGADGYLVNEEDITSIPSLDEGAGTKDPSAARIDFRESDATAFTWLPYTLRKAYLFALFALSIALALVVILLR